MKRSWIVLFLSLSPKICNNRNWLPLARHDDALRVIRSASFSMRILEQIDMNEKETIIKKLLEYKLAQNRKEAECWLFKRKIPAFGYKTAAELIKTGNADMVADYIVRVYDGGYA